LSKRIEKLVELFPGARSVADIGCDHGYTSILLAKTGKAEKIIACDIGQAPLESAKKNILREGLTDRIECRLGDGLEPIKPFEVETVLISGMGGPLMTEILENRIEEFSFAVLSPQSDFAKFRRFIFDRMEIVKEEYLEEGGKFYRLFLARKKQSPESQEIEQEEKQEERENEPKKKEDKKEFCRTAVEWEYGWLPLQEKDPVLKRMLEKEEKQYKEILEKKQIKEVKEKLELVNKALLYYRTPRNKT
jgi:ribosomal protein L11 methyltransferase (prmA)